MARTFGVNVLPTGTALTTSNITSDDAVNATVASAGAGGTLQSSTTQVHHGSTSMRHVGGGTAVGQCRLPFPATTANAAATSFYHRRDDALTTLDIAHIRRNGGQLWRIGISATGAIQAKSSTGTVLGSSVDSAWATGRWNRIEAKWDNAGGTSAGTLDIEVFDGDGTTPTGTLSLTGQNLGTAVTTDLEILSPSTSSFAGTQYYDTIRLASGVTTFIGPHVTGTLDAATPKATASISGTVTSGEVTGTLDASVPMTVIVQSGTVAVAGTMSASTPLTTSSISGAVDVAGTMSGTTPKVTSSASGTVAVAATMTSQVPKVTASISGTVGGIVSGSMSSSVPNVSSAAAGTVNVGSTLTATTPQLTGAALGSVAVPSTATTTLPALASALSGTVSLTAALTAALPLTTGLITTYVSPDRLTPWSLEVTTPGRTVTLSTPGWTLDVITPDRSLELET